MKVDLTPCGRRYRNYSLYASCRWTSILWHTLRWSLERNMLNRWKLGSLEDFFHSTCKDVIEGYCIPKLSLILERNQVYRTRDVVDGFCWTKQYRYMWSLFISLFLTYVRMCNGCPFCSWTKINRVYSKSLFCRALSLSLLRYVYYVSNI